VLLTCGRKIVKDTRVVHSPSDFRPDGGPNGVQVFGDIWGVWVGVLCKDIVGLDIDISNYSLAQRWKGNI